MGSTTELGAARVERSTKRVLVVDDQRSFSDAMQLALDAQPDLECVGVALDGAWALELVEALQPDVVLLDVQLPDADGVRLAGPIRRASACAVVILTGRPDADVLARAIEAGVAGFVLKDHPFPVILAAVRDAGARDGRDRPLRTAHMGGAGHPSYRSLSVDPAVPRFVA